MAYRPSHREKFEQKQNLMLAAGLVSERFPDVSSIALRLTYFQKTVDPVLMERTVNFCPTSYALFRMECLRDGCCGGGFDLTPVVDGLVKCRKTSGKGRIVCQGKELSLGAGHATLAYQVNIEYRR